MRTNTFGYTVLFTNTQFTASENLKIYREKDVIENAFPLIKSHLEPFLSRTEEGTWAGLFLTALGYNLVTMIAEKCGISYNQVPKTISGKKEVVYSDGSHSDPKYTKEQRELLDKLKIVPDFAL